MQQPHQMAARRKSKSDELLAEAASACSQLRSELSACSLRLHHGGVALGLNAVLRSAASLRACIVAIDSSPPSLASETLRTLQLHRVPHAFVRKRSGAGSAALGHCAGTRTALALGIRSDDAAHSDAAARLARAIEREHEHQKSASSRVSEQSKAAESKRGRKRKLPQ